MWILVVTGVSWLGVQNLIVIRMRRILGDKTRPAFFLASSFLLLGDSAHAWILELEFLGLAEVSFVSMSVKNEVSVVHKSSELVSALVAKVVAVVRKVVNAIGSVGVKSLPN